MLDGHEPDGAEYEARFDASFRAEIGLPAFTGVTAQIRSLAPAGWRVESVQPSADGDRATAVLRSGAVPLSVQIAVEAEAPHRITTLLVRPVPPVATVGSFDELTERLEGLAPTTALLVAEISDGTCRPLAAAHADQRVPIASVVKLYVLGAVARRIVDGNLEWDHPVVIRDELDSLPSGSTQHDEAGSTITVERLAQRTIAESDNTATDHLMDLVGRAAVEAAQGELGHSEPSVNIPFPSTREMFLLKLELSDAQRASYIAGTPE